MKIVKQLVRGFQKNNEVMKKMPQENAVLGQQHCL
jgi:hypothetical protein